MTSVVYFIECGGRIKIGVTTNLKGRLAAIATSSPFQVHMIGTVPGDASDEARFHMRLAEYRTKGEWFNDAPEVRQTINTALANGGIIAAQEQPAEPAPEAPRPPLDQDDMLFAAMKNTQTRFMSLINSKLIVAAKAANKAEVQLKAPRGSFVANIVDPESFVAAFACLKRNFALFGEVTEVAFDALDAEAPCDPFIERARALLDEAEDAFRNLRILKPDLAPRFAAV